MTIHLQVEDFNPDQTPIGTKQSFFLKFNSSDGNEQLGMPVLVANGQSRGQTLVAIAGVHGDELEGVQAIHEVFNGLNVESMSGRLIAVPVANVPAYRAFSRLGPSDSLNLARVFPGKRDGSNTERIAFHLSESIIRHADFFIDLHSGGMTYLLPTMVGYDASETEPGKASKTAAFLFGTPVIWGHPDVGPGRSLSEAIRRRIPWLYVESPGGGRVRESELPYYINGILNLLKHLNILPGKIESHSAEFHLLGAGDLDRAIAVKNSGVFVCHVDLLQTVSVSQVVGTVKDLFGNTVEEVLAPQDGVVGMLRVLPMVSAGDSVCQVVALAKDSFKSSLRLKVRG